MRKSVWIWSLVYDLYFHKMCHNIILILYQISLVYHSVELMIFRSSLGTQKLKYAISENVRSQGSFILFHINLNLIWYIIFIFKSNIKLYILAEINHSYMNSFWLLLFLLMLNIWVLLGECKCTGFRFRVSYRKFVFLKFEILR